MKNRVDQLIAEWAEFVEPEIDAESEYSEWTIRFMRLLLCKGKEWLEFQT